MSKPRRRNNGRGNKPNKPINTRGSKDKDQVEDYKGEKSVHEECMTNTGSSNDVLWYKKNEQLFRDTASYYVSKPTGTKLDWRNNESVTFGFKSVSESEQTLPGILSMHWVPSTGSITVYNGSDGSYNQADIVQLAAKDVFNYTVHANSRKVDYESADIAMTTMAADSIYSIISAMARIYGVCRVYDQQNKYLGDALLEAMGINGQALRDYGLSHFRDQINDLIARASTVWIPDRFDFIKRHYWLNSLVYRDSTDITGQLYVTKQDVYFLWEPKTSTQGSQLTAIDFHDVKSPAEWVNAARRMIDAIMYDEDPQTMMGDFLKAYGAENIFQLQPISEDYIVVPTFNEEVLLQLHNATLVPLSAEQRQALAIKQIVDSQTIYMATTVGWEQGVLSYVFPGPTYLDFPKDWKIDADAVMVATRDKAVVDVAFNANLGVTPDIQTGSELFVEALLLQLKVDGSLTSTYIYSACPTASGGGLSELTMLQVAKLAKFDYAPLVYVVSTNGTGGSTTWNLISVIGDINKGAVLDSEDLTRLHEVALMSEWNVPNIK